MILETGKKIDSGLPISIPITNSQALCQSVPSGIIQIGHSISFIPSSILVSFADFPISGNVPFQSKPTDSQIILQTRKITGSDLPVSVPIVNSHALSRSLTGRQSQIQHSISFHQSSMTISFAIFSISSIPHSQSPFPASQTSCQTRKAFRSESLISFFFLNTRDSGQSQTYQSDELDPSYSIDSSLNPLCSANTPTHGRLPMSEASLETKTFPVSPNVVQTSFLSWSLWLSQTVSFLSIKGIRTAPWISSDKYLSTDLSISVALILTRPFDGNSGRVSHQWTVSNNINLSIVDRFGFQSFRSSNGFHSNFFLISLSYFPSILLPTMNFLSDIDRDLKASLGSVKITSGSVGGGGFIALIAIVAFCCLLYRRRSGQNRPQSQPEVFHEFDLPIEHNEEEESEDENAFDLENGKDSYDPFDSESLERDRNPGGRDLRMHFDGEESFASFTG
jgi:hypothetical protein